MQVVLYITRTGLTAFIQNDPGELVPEKHHSFTHALSVASYDIFLHFLWSLAFSLHLALCNSRKTVVVVVA